MEYQYTIHHKLLEIFTKTYFPDNKLKPEEFSKEIRQTFHDFMEECDLNEKDKTPTENISFFTRIRKKYKYIKEDNFLILDSNSFVYKIDGEKYNKKSDNNHAKILSTLLTYLDRIIDYLHKMRIRSIKEFSVSNSKNRPEYPSFITRIDDKNLRDAYGQLIKLNFISDKTSLDSFKSVFQGKTPKEKIRWKGKPGFLRYFIISINGKGIEPIKSYWKTTVECFKNDETDSDFNISQLQFGHDPKNTKDIDLVIQTFNDSVNDYL